MLPYLDCRDVDHDGTQDYSLAEPKTRTLVIWDGSSLPGDGPIETVSLLGDLDGDAVPELWVKRSRSATHLYSSSGRADTRAREP